MGGGWYQALSKPKIKEGLGPRLSVYGVVHSCFSVMYSWHLPEREMGGVSMRGRQWVGGWQENGWGISKMGMGGNGWSRYEGTAMGGGLARWGS